MKTLQETSPREAEFWINLYRKAQSAYSSDDFIPTCDVDVFKGALMPTADLQDLEMLRIGFQYGRVFERLGVVI